MSDANEEIVKLQNKIAELEEDKGNLQLHLVDFDELKGKMKIKICTLTNRRIPIGNTISFAHYHVNENEIIIPF